MSMNIHRTSRCPLGNVTVHQSKRITRDFMYLRHPITHVTLQRPIGHTFKPIRTGVLVGQGGAHPRLHVAHLEPKRLDSQTRGSELTHLLQRAADLVDRVAEIGEAVVQSRRGSAVRSVLGPASQSGDVGGHAASLGETHAYGDFGELTGALLYGAGVTGQGVVAEVGVQRCAAARADEFCAVGCGIGCGSAGSLVSEGWGWLELEE